MDNSLTQLTQKSDIPDYYMKYAEEAARWYHENYAPEVPLRPCFNGLTPSDHKAWNKKMHRLHDTEAVVHSLMRKAQDFVKTQEYIEQIQFTRHHTLYYLVTFNAKPGVTIQQLQDHVISIMDTDKIEWAHVVYEVTSNTQRAPHAHVLLKRNPCVNKANFPYRVLRRNFKSVVNSPKAIDIKCMEEDELEKAYSYITKARVDPSKQASHNLTLAWREENEIEPLYTLGESPLLVCDSDSEELI